MYENKYEVFINHENYIVATEMDIYTATILARALLEEYSNDEHETKIGIRKMKKATIDVREMEKATIDVREMEKATVEVVND